MMDHLIRREELRGLLSNNDTLKSTTISVLTFDASGLGDADTTDIAMSDREERDGEGPKAHKNRMV
jgi:hypothetical protein